MNYPFKIEIVDSQTPNIPMSRRDSENLLIFGIPQSATIRIPSERSRYRASGDTEINVDLRFHSCEIEHLESLRPSIRRELVFQVIEDAKRRVYDEFIHFLQITARPVTFFPLEALRRYRNQRYSLILASRIAHEVSELSGISMHSTDEVLIFNGCELEVNEHPQLMEPEAYIVASNRYAVFLHPILNVQSVDVYRSDFIELNQRTLPPIRIHAQMIVDVIQQVLQPSIRRRRMTTLFDIIQGNLPPEEDPPPSKLLTKCPKCNGRLKRLGGDDYFCLDCDWDNLKPM
jgi:hypothetical protein